MSEYKYACPVCGQHMKCDSSQAGTVMECPTCFQKITAPQAPAAGDDQKFVLTGTKVGERPVPKIATESSSVVAVVKNSPVGIVVVALILTVLIGAGAAVYAFRGKIFKPADASVAAVAEQIGPASGQPVPVANDANWTLNLEAASNLPGTPAAGRIHGQDFLCERAVFQNGALTLRSGTRGPVEFGLVINFRGAQAQALTGESLNVTTNADTAARVMLRWKDGDRAAKESFDSGYAMRLEFGALEGSRIPGKIYLCLPDDSKSYVMGTFNTEIRKPKAKAPKK